MSQAIYSDLRTVIYEVTSTDRHQATSGKWWGLVLQDLHLALGSSEVLHVEWLGKGEVGGDFEAQVIVFTKDLIVIAEFNHEADGSQDLHYATVWPRKALTHFVVSGTNGAGDHNGTGRVEVELTLADGKELFLPLDEYTWDQGSLKTLIASLPADLIA